jgi:hypothetical protein
MGYTSVIPEMWQKLRHEGSARRYVDSQRTFETVCHAFYQAENCPQSAPASRDIKLFRAEHNIWTYFCELHSPKSWTIIAIRR